MKGIILAGGTGSRLFPLTRVTNKHLLPVGHWPMIYHPIYKLREAGIQDIIIITGKEHVGDVINLLGSGKRWGLKFTYRVQDEAGGIAQALGLCKEFVEKDNCTVLLGDNIFEDAIKVATAQFEHSLGARVFLKTVPDPKRFGVAELDARGKVSDIQEKPKQPKSFFAVTGIYMYDFHVFDLIKDLEPSARGELEITDVNNYYIRRNTLECVHLNGYWSDAGTFVSLQEANKLVRGDENIKWEKMRGESNE